MGIALLKKINQMMPDSIKVLMSSFIRKRLINNPVFVKEYNFLQASDQYDEDDIDIYVFNMTKQVLIHAYEHTKYYKTLFDEIDFDVYSFSDLQEMNKIPYLTKTIILEHFEELQADDISDYYMATTGGSSGVPLTVNLDRESIYKERAFVYHYWSKYGYDYKKSKVASFRGTDFNGKLFKYNPLYREIQCNPCSINDDTIELYLNKMDKFGVDYIHGFPSAVYCFCKYVAKKEIDIRGKYKAYFAISENLYRYQKNLIEEVLGCKCIPFYGHTERSVFAEIGNEGYKFNPFYGLANISNSNNTIVCTGFLNKKMPLIQYNLDDTATKLSNNDEYDIHGHRTGMLYGFNGEIISAAALEVHSDLLTQISGYQFLQREIGKVIVYIVPFTKLSDEQIYDLENLFQKKVGTALKVSLECSSNLKHTSRGKTELIIQELHIDNIS